jgi:hypothetical protein
MKILIHYHQNKFNVRFLIDVRSNKNKKLQRLINHVTNLKVTKNL